MILFTYERTKITVISYTKPQVTHFFGQKKTDYQWFICIIWVQSSLTQNRVTC